MAGVVGTTAMLAEASGTGADIDVARVPAPASAATGDWLTCFPGFAMLTADPPGTSRMPAAAGALAQSAECGVLTARPGVRLRWPDGALTDAVPGPATGLGTA
jgi:selenophosphate synthetase-related protein